MVSFQHVYYDERTKELIFETFSVTFEYFEKFRTILLRENGYHLGSYRAAGRQNQLQHYHIV